MASRDPSWKTRQFKRVSAYQFFLRAVLEEMKSRFPDDSIVLSQVSKLCAENWQAFPESYRQRFQDEADALNLANCVETRVKKKKKARAPGPKRPLSAFILFCKDNRQAVKEHNPGLSMGQISSVLSIMWSNTEKDIKSMYKKMAREQREAYREEMNGAKKAEKAAAKNASEETASDTVQDKMEKDVNEDNFMEAIFSILHF